MKRMINKYYFIKQVSVLTMVICIIISFVVVINWISVKAEETLNITGDKYKFSDDDEYPISQKGYNGSTDGNSFGIFSLSGDYAEMDEKNGFKAYDVKQGNLRLSYNFDSYKLSLPDESWNIYDDGCDEIDGFELEDDINNGTIIVLSSINGVKWAIDKELSNVFVYNSVLNNGSFYETKTVQLINGCYYKVIIAYEMRIKSGSIGFGSFSKNTYDYFRFAEVYKFYAINTEENEKSISPEQEPKTIIREKTKVGKDNGYVGNEAIDVKDPHYGWHIGSFIINGYTQDVKDEKTGDPIFLKNVGDRVTLWFNLEQNIDCINGDKDIVVDVDKDGNDQYFEVPKMNFKRGALIIRYTNREGNKTDPIIYTNYLAACTSTGAYTKVELFEEGDYEVALDYSIKDSRGWISSTNDYRIFFKFSIRNGNCMAFLFDIKTKSELANNDITPNGFMIDMAKSKYLDVHIEKSIIKKNGNLYSLDVRSNKPEKDLEKYDEEGIYKIEVSNKYTQKSEVKTIYVGDSAIIKALKTNDLTIKELNEKIKSGAEIGADGEIIFPTVEEKTEIESTDVQNLERKDSQNEDANSNINTDDIFKENNKKVKTSNVEKDELNIDDESASSLGIIVLVVVIICGIATAAFIYITKIKSKNNGTMILADKQVIEKMVEKEKNQDTVIDTTYEKKE